jgi:uncharacterized membrane protein YqaE (UPF0057 family)
MSEPYLISNIKLQTTTTAHEAEQMDNKIVMILIAVFLPPIAVFMKKGMGKDLVINVLLCSAFLFPGSIHAVWIATR